jgi:mono/diheme cytochrome c family protein
MKTNKLPLSAGVLVILLGLLAAGCGEIRYSKAPPIELWPDMRRQPKIKAQEASDFWGDSYANRKPVPGTVAVGYLKEEDAYYTGQQNGSYVNNPVEVTAEVLERGEDRYNIYCAPCHDRVGSGRGIVSLRSQGWIANSLIEQRIVDMPDGELFYVVSMGRRSMPGYRWQIEEDDRWAIVAYIRALQRAANGVIEDVPADLRSELR